MDWPSNQEVEKADPSGVHFGWLIRWLLAEPESERQRQVLTHFQSCQPCSEYFGKRFQSTLHLSFYMAEVADFEERRNQ